MTVETVETPLLRLTCGECGCFFIPDGQRCVLHTEDIHKIREIHGI